MFDRSLLPEAEFEFALVSDLHFMLDRPGMGVEFQSRMEQSTRAARALRMAAALEPAFVVHLGDLVQEIPGTPEFDLSQREALECLRGLGVDPHWVAGNHDVGDKADPTLLGLPVRQAWLDAYHDQFGPSWYSFDRGNCHFVVLNAQLFNSELADRDEQRRWLEDDLANRGDGRTFVFLHMPLYLADKHEPGLGNYDNVDEPDRSWLIGLLGSCGAEMVVTGHIHFGLYNREDGVDYLGAVSPSFTRPGFGHLFTAAAPPERGRNDQPKLGFYLFRVLSDRTDVQFIRTGESYTKDLASRRCIVLTPPSGSNEGSPLGISLRHSLGAIGEVPLAWPSAVRQRVRNDYPLFSVLEAGVGCVRTPLSSLQDTFQRRRVAVLRDHGVKVVGTLIGSVDVGTDEAVLRAADRVDEVEIQCPGGVPSQVMIEEVRRVKERVGVPVVLGAIVPGARMSGKQHPRTRLAFQAEDLVELEALLQTEQDPVDRVLCKLEGPESLARAGESRLRSDWLLELDDSDDASCATRVAQAAVLLALNPGSRLYVDPLIDLDRTMDLTHGLLDTLCNPRGAFHALRIVNALLYGPRGISRRYASPPDLAVDAGRSVITLTWSGAVLSLLAGEIPPPESAVILAGVDDNRSVSLYRLVSGTRESGRLADFRRNFSRVKPEEPLAFVSETE